MKVETQEPPAPSAVSAKIREEFQALVSGCGVYRLDRAHVVLGGADRVRWLNGMITNNVRDLVPGHGVYAFLLNPQGKIQGDLYAFNHDDTLIVETEPNQVETILQIFDRYIIMDEVEVENQTGKTASVGIAGRKSGEILKAVGFRKEMHPLEFAAWNFRGIELTVTRSDNPCIPSFELGIVPDQAGDIFKVLLEAGATRVSEESLETFRIACGIPKFGQDVRERDLPQETGQDRALNFTKGCYIGQEIVERIRSRGAVHRILTGFEATGMVSPGARIQVQGAEGKDIGEITSAAVVPGDAQDRVLALGYIRKEFMVPRTPLSMGDVQITPVPLPFKF